MTARRKRIGVIALGAALSLLLGSGLFALASDSVRSTGNSVQSGTFTAPVAVHDVKAAHAANAGACSSATYTDVPIAPLVTVGAMGPNINLQTPSGTTQSDVVCVKNFGTQTGRLHAIFNQVVQTEVGACQASESTAGDTTCADLAVGELKPIITAEFREHVVTTACGSVGSLDFSSWELAGRVLSANVPPGQICAYQLVVGVLGSATDNQKLQAQTDKVQWDITFLLDDAA